MAGNEGVAAERMSCLCREEIMRTKIRRTAIIPLVTVLLFYLAHPANVLLSGTTGEVRGLRGLSRLVTIW